ncbi:hypothetical protein [Micromonospora haikouensis]|uniref:hypothetical protein n=1 Tax=Micromonospora haikouensis TaxID=686309 RepID=UPI003D712232
MSNRGAYFVANDAILDLAIAFLNSFRAHNPSIPLCLVPFGDDVGDIAALAGEYDFSVWRDQARLDWCDDISRRFHGHTVGQYRKLAIWDGPFDEFVYIDTDTVVLSDIGFTFRLLDRFDFLTSHSDLPDIRRWVWKDSVYAAGALSRRQVSYSANTGFVVSRKPALTPASVEARLPAALALAEHMELSCYEQPLLNYLIVTAGGGYGSLLAVAAATGSWRIPLERWAGDPSLSVRDGRVVGSRTPSLLMHWAGEWARARATGRQIPYVELWKHYRRLREPVG